MSRDFRPCEPRLHSLQEFSIEKLREESKAQEKDRKETDTLQDKNKCETDIDDENSENFGSLDCVDRLHEKLRKSVSFEHNKFLALRWKKFQENIPKKPLIIVSYDKLHKPPKTKPRKFMLNGNFFSSNNELWPVPHGYIKLG